MSLLDDLRNAGRALDVQFEPNPSEVSGILGALVHYTEHGDKFLQAVEKGAEDVTELLSPSREASGGDKAAPTETGPSAAATSSLPPEPVTTPEPADRVAAPPEEPLGDAELDARIADLQAQRDSRTATSQQTRLTPEPGEPFQGSGSTSAV